MTTSLTIDDLRVSADGAALLRGVSIRVTPGVPLTIVGETGSGKTLVAEAAMGTLAPELSASGWVVLGGTVSDAGDRAARRHLWGRGIALLPQEPWLALDPTMRVLPQVAEGHRFVRGLGRSEATACAREDLAALGLANAATRFPHQLSGGMAQRVAVAAARAGGAPLLLADEPTKGLDAALRDAVVALLRGALQEGGSLLCITHDVAVARALGGEVMVMLDGEVVERGSAEKVLDAPSHAYTRRLLAAEPEAWAEGELPVPGAEVLSATGLSAERGGRRLFEALDLTVGAGEWVAVTGPSGCGKTTLGNVLLGLLRPAAGVVRRRGGLVRTRYQKLYQDPVATFAPRLALRTALAEAAALHGVAWSQLAAMLDRLRVPDALLDRRPDQVSGGELQRIAIARALLPDPVFLFADEPTSRLDPITQQETMAALQEISRERGLAVLLVTHDLAMARKVAGRQVTLRGA
ncbi:MULTISPECIES: ABC transporter ATP-binding protein [Roseomonadaceae]|uniref:ABC transporter ATP-binding protein n=1 Tax=Falsiroseomonas oleicola TaxID=2801474 RepID=A0ABS6H9L6_9PROT|nr:ATP-binding cassette domain-containing protein [Roseomonas oleicola]MBU8544512.1 ABC transporter ATP-binding protein [Roseomonas oleicola]